MKQCYLFDYEDSFTHNIASELRLRGVLVSVIPLTEIKKFLLSYDSIEPAIFLHGPGPGHPEDYRDLFSAIEKSFSYKNVFHVGLCLGHQIFCTLWGGKIKKSISPMHGRRVSLSIPGWSIFQNDYYQKRVPVQRYNSLSLKESQVKKLTRAPKGLKVLVQDGEVLMTEFKQGLSYQFHPESVGTSYRSLFFEPLRKFLL